MSRMTRAPRTAAPRASTTIPRKLPRDCAVADRHINKFKTMIADDLIIDFIFYYSLLLVPLGADQFPFDLVASFRDEISRASFGHGTVDVIDQVMVTTRADAVELFDKLAELI